ncbi:hypothetical protein [Streptomyces sp. NPDC059979]|uniref:hypothetical protein n=1 Tax=Streptomyces sp. NPDC059979 TaxID=3347021 RepID=UPI0036BE78CB
MGVYLPKLSDVQALSALRLVAYRLGLPTDMETLRTVQEALPAALPQDELPEPPPGPPLSAGEIARAALASLADDPDSGDAVDWAVRQASDERGAREPLMLVVGALVVIALRTEVLIERHPKRGVTVRVHLKPTTGPLMRQVLSQVLGLAAPAQPAQELPQAPPPEAPPEVPQ